MMLSLKSRRGNAAIALAAAGLLALTACGGASDDNAPQSVSGNIKGDISFQTWNLKAGFADYFNGLIAEFEKENPGTHVKWLDQPAENYVQKLQAQVTSNSLPDVVNTGPELAYPLAKAGALLNLAKADPKAGALYLPGAWNASKFAGGLYSYPWYMNTGPNFYNTKLFAAAGLDPTKPPKTYDEMLTDAAILGQHVKGKYYMWGNVPGQIDLALYGVDLMNKDQTKYTFNTAKAAKLLTNYKAAYDAGGILPAGLSMQYTGVGEAFMNGQVAMNSGSAYDLKNFEKNAPDLAANLGIAPAFSSTGQYEMSVQNLSISAKSKNIPTAAAFAKFVTGKKQQMAFAKVVNVFPSSADTLSDPFFTKEDGTKNTTLRVAAAKQLGNAVQHTPVVSTDAMATYIQQQFSDAILGKQTVEQALDNAVNKCNQLLGSAK